MAEKNRNRKLECSICLGDFVKPKIIDCFHTFCEECLIEYVKKRSMYDYGHFKCPICRKSIRIPAGGVKSFSTNFYIEEKSQPEKKVVCKVHNLAVEYFCKECCQTVCFKCFVTDHRGHEGDFISDVGGNFKQDLESMRKDLSERIIKATRYSNWLFSEKSKLQFLSDGECDKVDRQVKKINEEVQSQGCKLKKEIKKNYQDQCKELSRFHDDMQCMINSLKELEKKVDDICHKESLVEVLSLSAIAQVKSMICNYYGYKDHPFGLPSGLTLQFKKMDVSPRIISKLIGKVQAGFSFSKSNDYNLHVIDSSNHELKTQLESVLVHDVKEIIDDIAQSVPAPDLKSTATLSAIPKKFSGSSTKSGHGAIQNQKVPDTVPTFRFSATPKQATELSQSHMPKGNCIPRTKASYTKSQSVAVPKGDFTCENLNGNSSDYGKSGNKEKSKTESAGTVKKTTDLQIASCSSQNTAPKTFGSSSDQNNVVISSLQNKIKSLSVQSAVKSSSDQSNVNSSSEQNDVKIPLVQKSATSSPDQNTTKISPNQTTFKTPCDQVTAEASSNQNTVQTPSNDEASSSRECTASSEKQEGKSLAASEDAEDGDKNNCHEKNSAIINSKEIKTIPKNTQSQRSTSVERKIQPKANPLHDPEGSIPVDVIYGETLPKLKTNEMDDIVKTERGKIEISDEEKIINLKFDIHDIESGSAKVVKKLKNLDLYVTMGVDNKSYCYIDIGVNNLGLYKMYFSVNVKIEKAKVDLNQFVDTNMYGYWGPFYRWHQVLDKETILDCSEEVVNIGVKLFDVKRIK